MCLLFFLKSTKEVFNLQGAWHSKHMLLTMVHTVFLYCDMTTTKWGHRAPICNSWFDLINLIIQCTTCRHDPSSITDKVNVNKIVSIVRKKRSVKWTVLVSSHWPLGIIIIDVLSIASVFVMMLFLLVVQKLRRMRYMSISYFLQTIRDWDNLWTCMNSPFWRLKL